MQNLNVVERMSELEEIQLINDQLLPVRTFCARFSWPSESAMRSYIYRAEELGIQEAFCRFRRRVLINPRRFFELIKQLEYVTKKGGENENSNAKR